MPNEELMNPLLEAKPQHNPQLFYREFRIEGEVGESRELDLSFSSEAPVPRWFGKEILLHGENNVKLDRLNSKGSLLINHDPNKIAGPVKRSSIQNKRGIATVGFDDDDMGNWAKNKVKWRSLRGASVGYMVKGFRELLDGEEYEGFRGPAFLATEWEPIEISLTPIPMDSSVGVGRDFTRSLDGIVIERSAPAVPIPSPHQEGDSVMAETAPAQKPAIDERQIRELVNNRLSEYSPILQRAQALEASHPGALSLAARMVGEIKSVAEIQDALLTHVETAKQKPAAPAAPSEQTPGLRFSELPDDVLLASLSQPNPY